MNGKLVHTFCEDGVKLDGFLAAESSRRVWLLFHGVNSSFYSSSLLREIAAFLLDLGFGVLLANNRGHDLCSISYGQTLPQRIGSQFESIESCVLDFQAWEQFLITNSLEPIGLAAHSLGAVKGAYWLSQAGLTTKLKQFLAISPPRLNTSLIADNSKRGAVFCEQLEKAREMCQSGDGEKVIKVRYPLPTWVSAATFVDKYGSGDKYDYLTRIAAIDQKTIWAFGETEVSHGMNNFRNADLAIRDVIESASTYQHSVTVIEGGDHSYTNKRPQLLHSVRDWLSHDL
ncbi:alpha/beta hydrolase [Pirellulaceae bacterium SH449]